MAFDKKRKEISLTMSMLDLYLIMSEGNPGALTVLMELNTRNMLIMTMHLDDMNIRGTQIWLGYSDFCNKDMDKFIELIKNRDQDMVNYINAQGLKGNHPYKAVQRGASDPRIGRELLDCASFPNDDKRIWPEAKGPTIQFKRHGKFEIHSANFPEDKSTCPFDDIVVDDVEEHKP